MVASVKFEVDGESYIGYTVVGSARMRIHRETDNGFVAAFDPDDEALRSDRPDGTWAEVAPGIDERLLDKLKPEAIARCRRRLQWFDEARKQGGAGA